VCFRKIFGLTYFISFAFSFSISEKITPKQYLGSCATLSEETFPLSIEEKMMQVFQ
jgi:hypothetical protein